MAVAVVLEFEGATLDQYDEVLKLMGLTPKGAGPPGALFHWAAKTDSGFLVTDVWETRELFDAFAQDKIGPLSAQVGLPNPPKITYHDVHSHLTAG